MRYLALLLAAVSAPAIAATPTFTISGGTANEGQPLAFTITKTDNAEAYSTLNFTTVAGTAKGGINYESKTVALQFRKAETSQTVYVSTKHDGIDTANLTFTARIGRVRNAIIGGSGSATGTIVDIDGSGEGGPAPTCGIGNPTPSISESAGSLTLTINCSGNNGRSVVVHYATANGTGLAGTDYTASSGDRTLTAGQASTTFAVPVTANSIVDGSRTFSVALTPVSNASISNGATVTITDDDTAVGPAPTCSLSNASVSESAGSLSMAASCSGNNGLPVSLHYATANGTAAAGTDYTAVSGNLSLASGATASSAFSVPIIGNAIVDGSRAFNVNLTANSNATIGGSAVVTITDDDTAPAPVCSVNSTSVAENAGPLALTISCTGNNGSSSTVHYATANQTALAGTDYTSAAGDITIGSGVSTSAPFNISITNNGTYQGSRAFAVNLTPVTNVSIGHSAVVTINDDEAPPVSNYGLRPPIPTTDFSPALGIHAAALPPSNCPGGAGTSNCDDVGAFRFICTARPADGLTNDDATVYPGVPGASHLHDVSGRFMDANLTYEIARSTGGSTCNDVAGYDDNAAETALALNRTPYWQPSLIDGSGHAIRPDFNAFYYKREPNVQTPQAGWLATAACPTSRFPGGCQFIPFGLKFVTGANPSNPSYVPPVPADYICIWNNGQGVFGPTTMTLALQKCEAQAKAGLANVQFAPRIISGDCWDGVHTDSANHRDHISFAKFGTNGKFCDAAHPVHIPFFLFSASYTVKATDDTSTWHFSSDEMDPTKPRGWSFHIDYGPMSWDPATAQAIEDNCLNKLLSCQGGNLGNGTALKAADTPRYLNSTGHYVPSWTNPNRIVNIPPGLHP